MAANEEENETQLQNSCLRPNFDLNLNLNRREPEKIIPFQLLTFIIEFALES